MYTYISGLFRVHVLISGSPTAVHRDCTHIHMYTYVLTNICHKILYDYKNLLSRILLQHLFKNSDWNHETLRRKIWLVSGPTPGLPSPCPFRWVNWWKSRKRANAHKIRDKSNLRIFNDDYHLLYARSLFRRTIPARKRRWRSKRLMSYANLVVSFARPQGRFAKIVL